MTDASSNIPIVNKTGTAVVVGFILLFSVGIIVWTLIWGQAANGLHATAMSWAFTLIIVVLGAVGLAPLLTTVLPLVKK